MPFLAFAATPAPMTVSVVGYDFRDRVTVNFGVRAT